MNRGATAYGLRGTSLAVPNGTIDNPAVRFGRERSGLYRVGDGRLGLSVQRFRALELTQNDLLLRSNAPGAGPVSPLSLQRVNPTTADGQETGQDTYESTTRVGRLALYRAAAGRFGWKLYGSSAGVLSASLLTATPDGDLLTLRDLTVGRNATITGNLTVAGTLAIGAISVPTLSVTGPGTSFAVTNNALIGGSLSLTLGAGATALTIPNANAAIGGSLSLGAPAATTALSIPNANASIGGSLALGSATLTQQVLSAQGDLGQFGVAVNSAVLAATARILLAASAANANAEQSMWTNSGAQALVVGVQGGTGAVYLGNTRGDASIYTSGASAGRLVLGSQGTARLMLSAAAGLQHLNGATELGRVDPGGNVMWGGHPTHRFGIKQLADASSADGWRLTTATSNALFWQIYLTATGDVVWSQSGVSRQVLMASGAFSLASSDQGARFAVRQSSDVVTIGSGIRQVTAAATTTYVESILDANGSWYQYQNGIIRQILLSTGLYTLGAADLGIRFGVKQLADGVTGGIRSVTAASNALWYERWLTAAGTMVWENAGGPRLSLLAGGNLGVNATAPDARLHVAAGGNFDGVVIGPAAGQNYATSLRLINSASVAGSTQFATLGLSTAVGAYQGSVAGTLVLYTSGSAGGDLLFARNSINKLWIETNAIRIVEGGSEYFRFVTAGAGAGSLGIDITVPDAKLHIGATANGDGMVLAPQPGQSFAPAARWLNSGAVGGASSIGTIGMSTSTSSFIGSASGDFCIYNQGPQGGGMVFGTANTARMMMQNAGHVIPWLSGTYNFGDATHQWATISSVALALTGTLTGNIANFAGAVSAASYGAVSGSTGTFSGAVSAASYGAVSGTTGAFSGAITGAGYSGGAISGTTGTFSGLLSANGGLTVGTSAISCLGANPTTDNARDLGTSALRFRTLYLSASIGVGLAGAPSAQIELSFDQAKKPTTTTWQTTSDIRTKVEGSIRDYGAGLAELVALRPVTFLTNGRGGSLRMAEGDRPAIGLVADEAQTVAPELVVEMAVHEADEPEDSPGTPYLHLNAHPLFFMLINAVRELHARLEALEGAA